VREPTPTIVCEPCSRRGRYSADAKLLYLIADIGDCPKAQSTNVYDRSKVRGEGLAVR
jgi:hypothetical protein